MFLWSWAGSTIKWNVVQRFRPTELYIGIYSYRYLTMYCTNGRIMRFASFHRIYIYIYIYGHVYSILLWTKTTTMYLLDCALGSIGELTANKLIKTKQWEKCCLEEKRKKNQPVSSIGCHNIHSTFVIQYAN